MGEITGIGWTDHTFNPWIGCTKVSPACDNCYAADMAARYGWAKWGDFPRQRTAASTWKQPLAWNRKVPDGETRFVFCASLADVFDNQVDPQWRADLFNLIRATPRLTWLLLTKRIGNAVKMSEAAGGLPVNATLGATVVNQAEAERDVPALLDAKAKLRARFAFLSVEPMLGEMDLTCIWTKDHGDLNAFTGRGIWPGASGYEDSINATKVRTGKLDWVICGGESGANTRNIHPDWVRQLREQCFDHDAAFFFKQWGGRTPKANGKTLDGREHCDRPIRTETGNG